MGHINSGILAVVLVGFLLALMTLSPVSADEVRPEDPAEPAEEPWLNKDWDWYVQFYGDVRWNYIPGLRLTQHKQWELWDRALLYALVEDDWLGTFSENIAFDTQWTDREYKPVVPGKTFDHRNRDQAKARMERYGQIDRVWVSGPWRDVDITSVTASVRRRVSLSDARRQRHESGCGRSIKMRCTRNWGDWECEPTERAGTNCVDLAYDDRRWQELPELEMTREKRHALWNRILQHALVHDDWLGRPSGTIALSTELASSYDSHLDTDYKPTVAGVTIEPRDLGAIRELADQHGQFEYLKLSDYSWRRGPVTVRVTLTRTFAMCQARRSRRESRCPRTQSYECRESEDDWKCRVSDQWGDECDPSQLLATPCE